MERYTQQEQLLIDTYQFKNLSAKERAMIAKATTIEEQAKIVKAYRADLERWVDIENRFRKDKIKNFYTRTHEGNKVYGDMPLYDDYDSVDTYASNQIRDKKIKTKILKKY